MNMMMLCGVQHTLEISVWVLFFWGGGGLTVSHGMMMTSHYPTDTQHQTKRDRTCYAQPMRCYVRA